jgi:Uma2 family endonuclease
MNNDIKEEHHLQLGLLLFFALSHGNKQRLSSNKLTIYFIHLDKRQ